MRINLYEHFLWLAICTIICFFALLFYGCSSTITRYEYPNGYAEPVERIRMRGIGKAEVDGDKYKMESKPWVEVPTLPPLEFKQD